MTTGHHLDSADSPDSSTQRIVAFVACDFQHSPLGTPSRLRHLLAGKSVLRHTLERLLQVKQLAMIVLAAPLEPVLRQHALADLGLADLPATERVRVDMMTLLPRPSALAERIGRSRVWNLDGWRGGAGQFTVFDEDFYPKALHAAAQKHAADHLLCVPAHAPLIDPALLSALLDHHVWHNHDMRATFTAAAPGLCGMALRADLVAELAAADAVPGQLLAYDPRQPMPDTLGREACLQVDPAAAKIPNRLLADTARGVAVLSALFEQPGVERRSARELALATRELRQAHNRTPRELEIELTADRLTNPPGAVPEAVRQARTALPADIWRRWLTSQPLPDDLLLTLGGAGDPLLAPNLLDVLQAARAAGVLSIHVQTDLLTNVDLLQTAIDRQLVDVISVTCYGLDEAVCRNVSGYAHSAAALEHLDHLVARNTNLGGPLIIPRLLKTRATMPQMEAFFDLWTQRCGWAVIDSPTDRAGSIPFDAVVDMAPPRRRACRRLTERLLIHADGIVAPCDQDIHRRLAYGRVPDQSLEELWTAGPAAALRAGHAAGQWANITPCATCREWHRA